MTDYMLLDCRTSIPWNMTGVDLYYLRPKGIIFSECQSFGSTANMLLSMPLTRRGKTSPFRPEGPLNLNGCMNNGVSEGVFSESVRIQIEGPQLRHRLSKTSTRRTLGPSVSWLARFLAEGQLTHLTV